MSGALHLGARLADRSDDVWIGGAAADIAAHIFADRIVVSGMAFANARDRRHDLAGRAVAALEAVMIDEGLLHRVECSIAPGEAFDGRDRPSLGGSGQRQAGENVPSVGKHGAGAALAVVAAFLRAGQPEMLAQRIEKRRPRVELERIALTIDL